MGRKGKRLGGKIKEQEREGRRIPGIQSLRAEVRGLGPLAREKQTFKVLHEFLYLFLFSSAIKRGFTYGSYL